MSTFTLVAASFPHLSEYAIRVPARAGSDRGLHLRHVVAGEAQALAAARVSASQC